MIRPVSPGKYYKADPTTRPTIEERKAKLKLGFNYLKESLQIIGEPTPNETPRKISYGNSFRAIFRMLTTGPDSLTENQRNQLNTLDEANQDLFRS